MSKQLNSTDDVVKCIAACIVAATNIPHDEQEAIHKMIRNDLNDTDRAVYLISGVVSSWAKKMAHERS